MKNTKTSQRAAVIGSGFGGLAAAIRLQSQGFATTLIEKRDRPGGRAYSFTEQGFTFDCGPTVITAPQCLEDLFALSGHKMSDYVEMLPVFPFYRLMWDDGTVFDYSNDDDQLKKQMDRISPEDWPGYLKFLEYSRAVFAEGYEKLAHVPFSNFWSMVKVAPQLVQLQAFRSVYSMVAKYVKEEHLRQAFSFHSLLVGGNPFASSSIYTLIHFLERNWGVFFPKGGTGALVQALVKNFTDLGGELLLDSEVDEILCRERQVHGVRLKKGQDLPFDLVVSNADVGHTYEHLLKNEKSLKGMRRWAKSRSYSMSLFLIYFGTKTQYRDIEHHSVIFGPRYKELLADIFDKGVLAEDFSLYLHRPTKTDANLAPAGCDTFYVLSPVPHLGRAALNWDEIGPVYEKRILDYLEAKYMPDLQQNIVVKKTFTPFDFQFELNSTHGSAFSIEPVLQQSAYFRTQNRDKTIRGLYFVGAGTHPGAGVPGVVNSARATANQVFADCGLQSAQGVPLEL